MKYNDVIYQIFPRNYSVKGTFKDIENDLERIKELGTTIVYLMPIHIIGVKNRKGTYGSPYAIKDYYSISPDLGDLSDFSSLINKTHDLGMKLILDMVFNHTSPDNVLLNDHEDYYFHRNGKLSNRVGDWSDIVDLDTKKEETQRYLIDVLKYWINLGVDGFRFDVASMIPLSFFKRARKELGNEVIFVGESIDYEFADYLKSINDPSTPDDEMYPTFDSLYNYNFLHELHKYIKGEGPLNIIIERINDDGLNMRLLSLENHDVERITSILSKEKLEKWLDFFAFIKGQVFIYAGQEYGISHLPELFEKDPVDWSNLDMDIYRVYKSYIDRKINQKEITYQYIDIIGENRVRVSIRYNDNSENKREFELPRNN